MIRAFIAIQVPAEVLVGVEQLQRDCQAGLPKGVVRWTRPEQIHLTLRFLGNIAEESVNDLENALRGACESVAPLRLETAGLGCFPNPQRPRIVWVGLDGDLDSLRRLQQNIERETAAWGEPEERAFHAHLTIGRIKNAGPRDARALKALFDTRPTARFGEWRVDQVELVKSQMLPEGPIYTRLTAVPLGGGAAIG